MRDLDLLPAEPFPLAVAELGQPRIVAPLAGLEAERMADDLGGLAHAAERAAQEEGGAGRARELGLERAAHRLRLGAAAFSEA